MRKGIILISSIILSFCWMAGYGLEVDVDEIKTKPVVFINYKGKYDKPETVQEIESIGTKLSRNAGENKLVRFFTKYSLIRVIGKEEPEKFSADILSIDKDAKVGHIDAIRKIISAYLADKYGYTKRESEALALFITYYNAVHRGELKYFSSKYKTVVMRYISEKNAGISTRYNEWAGATKMLFPLTEKAQKGKLDSIVPEIITDKKTVEEIRRDDKNIPKRKDMVDLKERIIEKDKKEIEKEKEKLDVEKKKVAEEQKPVEKKKEEITKKQEDIKKEKEEAKKITEPEKRKEKEEEIKKKEQQIEAEKKEVKKKMDEIAKKEQEVKKEERKIEEKETKIAEREKDTEKEKKQIERDEIKRDIAKEPDKAAQKLQEKAKELDKREDQLRDKELDKNIYANKLYYLKIKEYLEGGHYNNDMYMIDASTRKIIFKSPVENICGSRYDIFSGGVVVITHRGNHLSGHRLALLDRETLQAKTYGNDNVFWRSFIEIRDGFIYAIMYDKEKYYLGRFDSTLKLVAKSREEINENTFISFFDNFIYINRLDKAIIVLNKEDLSLLDEVKP